MALPPLGTRPNGWEGILYFRFVKIPLPKEREFEQLWQQHKPAFLSRGFSVSFENGWTLAQYLSGKPGRFQLTPVGVLRGATMVQTELVFSTSPLELPELDPDIKEKLFGYQVIPTQQLLRALICGPKEWNYAGAVDTSDMGTGKTAMDTAAALQYSRLTGRKKIVVLMPVVGRSGWEAMFQHFGATPHYFATYEVLREGNRPAIVEQRGDDMHWKDADDLIIILDEAQALRHDDTLNFRLCAAAIRQNIPMIVASATLALSPIELRFAGRVTGLHQGGYDFERFLAAHGCVKTRSTWTWNKDISTLTAIHAKLFPRRGCRVRKQDTGKANPGTDISILLIDSPRAAVLEQRWKDAETVMIAMEKQGKSKSAIENAMRIRHMKCWQLAEEITVPFVAAHAKRRLTTRTEAAPNGRSVAMFMSFTESRLAMSKLMNTRAGFYGSMPQRQREYWQQQFQSNRERVLVNQIIAGGASVSLHDTTGDYPRSAYIWPHINPIAVQQATGRVDRVGGKSVSEQFIVAVRGPFSEQMVKTLRRRILQMMTLNDGGGQTYRF